MAYPSNIREEELKNLIAKDWFSVYDTTHILGDVDFSVAVPKNNDENSETEFLLWAEAKKGNSSIESSFAQLILTIGKARTFEKNIPPKFIGAFDAQGITFLPYEAIQEVFYLSDFNWNVTPSDYKTKEFQIVLNLVNKAFAKEMYSFKFEERNKELSRFIRSNFILSKKRISQIRISKNNFVVIYQKWLKTVKPTICVNWEAAKRQGVFDSDFYLADILSSKNKTIKEKLHVLLRETYYELDRKKNDLGLFTSSKATFNDEQKAHSQFWNQYERPPREEYWDYIIERKDLLVPQDIRERQGSYFTPQQWVELSQQYLEAEFGENWQEEYYIWDCAAGTGNLLNGLTNKYKIWASTLNKADVDVMNERIRNGANLLESHVFQFDFLNDSFDKLPERLREIINDEEKRKKLIIYINPPYKEHSDAKQITKTGKNISGLAKETQTYKKYQPLIGTAARELFAQFLFRIMRELPGVKIANFSTLKSLQAPNFIKFRRFFNAKLLCLFLMPSDTFDNVNGQFPIGFMIWDTNQNCKFVQIEAHVYDSKANQIENKRIYSYVNDRYVIEWIRNFYDKNNSSIVGYLRMNGTDVQHNNQIFITNKLSDNDIKYCLFTPITANNIIPMCIYCAIRKVIDKTWLNDRDQYLYPNGEWINDIKFQTNCLIYAIFENAIVGYELVNHWIPFIEEEVGARDTFKSHFMSDYISGKKRARQEATFFSNAFQDNQPLSFSKEATAVMDAGRELWKYYHSQEDSNPNASLYDIKIYFQGTKILKNGTMKMNNDSKDEQYTMLMKNLREKLKVLAKCIEHNVYEYEFLK